MFTNLNLPDSVLNDVNKILSDCKKDFGLPIPLLEAAKKVVPEYSKCVDLDEKTDILRTALQVASDKNNIVITPNLENCFVMAVNTFARPITK